MSTEAEMGRETVQGLIDDIGLGRQLSVKLSVTPRGNEMVELAGIGERIVLDQGGLSTLEKPQKQIPHLLKLVSRLVKSDAPQSATTQDLMRRESYRTSALTEIDPSNIVQGNTFLNRILGLREISVPCSYGSTGGLNMAELLETMMCADSARRRGIRSVETVFSMTGGEAGRARQILAQSTAVIPERKRTDFDDFVRNLGMRGSDQIRTAAEMLIGQDRYRNNTHIVDSDSIMRGLGRDFTFGKLLMLARLSGGDPGLFDAQKTSWEVARARREDIRKAVTDVLPFDRPDAIRGIVYYARDTVIAGDFPGYVLMPLKVTTHANIYKLLEGYEALASQRADRGEVGGALLCPIQKHRIQTRAQTSGGDPCDARVLAYLENRSPHAYRSLVQDFREHCRVLSPDEVVEHDGGDKRFIIENYFEI